MVALLIQDVPEVVRDTLAERARAAGISLQAYLRGLVLREAAYTDNAAVLDDIATWNRGSGAGLDDLLAALDATRKDTHA